MSSVRLFVYGSLKRGGRHHELIAFSRFLGEAETTPGFALETLPSGDYVALVERPGAPSSVPGELFEVDDARLPELDDFEGESYRRSRVPVREISGEIGFALAYLRNPR